MGRSSNTREGEVPMGNPSLFGLVRPHGTRRATGRRDGVRAGDACIRAIADPPLGASLLADTVFKTGVVIEAKAGQDSLAVNLVLQTSGT